MSRQRDREEFIALLTAEGVPLDVCRAVMRDAMTLHRLAELACSSEAADRDRVPCPGYYAPDQCLCRDYGAGRAEGEEHAAMPRYLLQEQRARKRIVAALAPFKVMPDFQGDPRGAVVKLKVPSGKTNDWGQVGICVP